MLSKLTDNRNPRSTFHARQIINNLIAPSAEHAACYMAISFGRATTVHGELSLYKLWQSTRLPKERIDTILADWRVIIANSGVL